MTDPIADYLTRLRNAIMAHHRVVEIPASNLKKEITKILFEKGYNSWSPEIHRIQGHAESYQRTGYRYPFHIQGCNDRQRGLRPENRRRGALLRLLNRRNRIMSRIGKLPIVIPAGVEVKQEKNVITVKGPKGELSQKVDPSINVKIENGEMELSINEESPVNIKQKQAFHGLYRSLVNNMVVGVSQGFQKTLELVGVGYRVSNQGNLIEFSLGYTHPIFLMLPPEVKVETKSERNQNPVINLESCDKQLLGLICAKIRSFRKPEPYKGKGILFKGEVIRRKSGKSASAK